MLMAPGIDGLETYKRILDFRPDQKALIASGYSHPSNVEEARAIGVSAYVMKPYTVMRLGEAVQEAFSVK
jgi:DNA-binding NarL/FixJ family response regulator